MKTNIRDFAIGETAFLTYTIANIVYNNWVLSFNFMYNISTKIHMKHINIVFKNSDANLLAQHMPPLVFTNTWKCTRTI